MASFKDVFSVALLLSLSTEATSLVRLATNPVAVPTPQQLQWMDLEVASMITWNLQTICSNGPRISAQHCQAAGFVPSLDAVRSWAPNQLDTDEWARVTASFGAKYVVLVADHMTGFALWDTRFHNYSIAHTAYKGGGHDVVKEMIDSCRKYDLKLGVFYSVHFNWYWGVDGFQVGHPPLGPRSYTQQEYAELAASQLQELLGLFNETGGPFELWFDGGLDSVLDMDKVGAAVAKFAPNTICHGCFNTTAGAVRWMGNEEGVQALPSWGAVPPGAAWAPNGDPLGAVFNPPVCDTVLREHFWFYQNDTEQHIKSTTLLVRNYLTSVGRGANLILNIAPDGTGQIPAADVAAYAAMGAAIECLFSQPIQGSTPAPLTMDATGVMQPAWVPASPIAMGAGTNYSLVLREELAAGQLVGNFTVQCQKFEDRSWGPCPMGALAGVIPGDQIALGVGHKRILMLGQHSEGQSWMVSALRVVVLSHFATGVQVPTLRDVSLFQWGSPEIHACV